MGTIKGACAFTKRDVWESAEGSGLVRCDSFWVSCQSRSLEPERDRAKTHLNGILYAGWQVRGFGRSLRIASPSHSCNCADLRAQCRTKVPTAGVNRHSNGRAIDHD